MVSQHRERKTIPHTVLSLPLSPQPVKNGDGTIDFREYVIGVTILCRPANTEDVLRMAFQVRRGTSISPEVHDCLKCFQEEFQHFLCQLM